MRPHGRHALVAALVPTVLLALVPVPAHASTTVGLWHMDETSGTTMTDDSGQANDGTLTDVSFVTPGFDGTGGAYEFNGTSSKVIVPDAPSLSPGDQDITITAHVNLTVAPSATVGDYDLVRKKGQRRMYRMEILSTGQAFCTFKGSGATKSIKSASSVVDGQWHTIACTKTASAVSLSLDGVSASKTIAIGSIANTTGLVLGGQLSGSQDLYEGVMDEVSILVG